MVRIRVTQQEINIGKCNVLLSVCVRVCSSRYPVVTGCNIEDGKKCQPNYTGGVHGESNKLGLVEILGALPGLEGIPRRRKIIFLIRETLSRKKTIPTLLKLLLF